MTFLDAFNGWSALHLLGSFILTTTLGTTSLGPLQVGLISFGLGAGWEVVADQSLRMNDERGGDYYDILWDLAGCAAGVAALGLSGKWNADYAAPPLGISIREVPDFQADNDATMQSMLSRQSIRIPYQYNYHLDITDFDSRTQKILREPPPSLARLRSAMQRAFCLKTALQKNM